MSRYAIGLAVFAAGALVAGFSVAQGQKAEGAMLAMYVMTASAGVLLALAGVWSAFRPLGGKKPPEEDDTGTT